MIQVSKYYDLEIFQGISKDILNRIFEASEINKYMEQIENEEYIRSQNRQISERLLNDCCKEIR